MGYHDFMRGILTELESALSSVDGQTADDFADALITANRVFTVGVGRVELSLLAFVKRLNHIGISATYVGAINEPAIGADDVLVIGSGSGETAVPAAIAKIAKKYGAKLIHIGSNTAGAVSALADCVIRIPCRTKLSLPDEIGSIQPMSSLFEQSLLLFLDITAMMIIEKKSVDIHKLWHTHANLE